MSRGAFCCFVVAAALGGGAPAEAQVDPVPGRVELGFGVLWQGSVSLGSIDATESTATAGPARIFSTSTDVVSAAGIEGRISVRLSRSLEAEASAAYSKPELRTSITNDIEASGTVIAAETIRQFTIGGGLLWYFPHFTSSQRSPRLRPFLAAGLGYLRQLHDPAILAATGQSYQIGGGVKYLLASRPRSRARGFGVRADARVVARRKGVAFDDRTRFAPALGASIFARF